MKALEDVDVSDGELEAVTICNHHISVDFRDWKNVLWRFVFIEPIAYEAISPIGESLSEFEIKSNCDYLKRCKKIAGEDVAILLCYSFISAWSGEPVFRVIARDFKVELVPGKGSVNMKGESPR